MPPDSFKFLENFTLSVTRTFPFLASLLGVDMRPPESSKEEVPRLTVSPRDSLGG